MQHADDVVRPMCFAVVCSNSLPFMIDVVHLLWYGFIDDAKIVHAKEHLEVDRSRLPTVVGNTEIFRVIERDVCYSIGILLG